MKQQNKIKGFDTMRKLYSETEINAMSRAEYMIYLNEEQKHENEIEFHSFYMAIEDFVDSIPKPLQFIVKPLSEKFINERESWLVQENAKLDIEINAIKDANDIK